MFWYTHLTIFQVYNKLRVIFKVMNIIKDSMENINIVENDGTIFFEDLHTYTIFIFNTILVDSIP